MCKNGFNLNVKPNTISYFSYKFISLFVLLFLNFIFIFILFIIKKNYKYKIVNK